MLGVAGPDLASMNWSSESDVSSADLLARLLENAPVANETNPGEVPCLQAESVRLCGTDPSSWSLPWLSLRWPRLYASMKMLGEGAPRGRVELTTARDGLSGDAEAVAIRSSGSLPPRALHSRLAALVVIVSFKKKSR